MYVGIVNFPDILVFDKVLCYLPYYTHYINDLLYLLENLPGSLFIGNTFCGAPTYAALVSDSPSHLQLMIDTAVTQVMHISGHILLVLRKLVYYFLVSHLSHYRYYTHMGVKLKPDANIKYMGRHHDRMGLSVFCY